ERACKKYPIEVSDKVETSYRLGKRLVFKNFITDSWMNGVPFDMTHYTEKEAVAYLLEGYKKDEPKLPDYEIKGLNGVTIHYDQESSKAVMNNLWNAGYRPTKEAK
ncbi:MAG: hypothetical protein PHD39_07570, partial [Methylobacter tundripaludum]|nr:hypothetical protein [Methylobacter tundripaludum]